MAELLCVEPDSPRAGAWRLVLDDPQRANALSPPLVSALQHALQRAIDSGARAVVFDSSSDRFCAGADLSDVDAQSDAALRERFGALEELLEAVRRAPLLTCAMVRGAALGAGADLVAACDYRIGTSRARLAFPGSRFGVVLGTRHLAAVIGRQQAREILVEGRMLDAEAALACGLLSELCADDAINGRVEAILHRAEGLDPSTLAAILRLTRDVPSAQDQAELQRSTSHGSLGARIRDHAQRAQRERDARRGGST